ncbi:MAG TPA: hypothetical protein VGF11_04940 [Acidimicrobiales bacterium]
MSGPIPEAGANPWTLGYQNSQFGTDTDPAATTPSFTVFGHLQNPPSAGVTASASPSILFSENTNPPIGAGDNEPGGGTPGS